VRRFIICLFGFLLPALAAPAIYDGGVVNGADFTLNFSPGMLISVFGTNLATATKLASGFPLPTAIDGVSVEVVDGARTLNAPLFFVSAGQINAQLPFDMTSTSVRVRVKNATGTSAAQTITIVARCPRILTKTMNGLGEAILTHADYTVVSADAPALAGEVVILYLAGLGAVSPSIAAGQAAGTGAATNPLNVVQDEVVVKVEGVASKIYYKGLAPYFAGLYQINFQVPDNAQQAISELTVEVGKQVSQGRVRFAVAMPLQKLTAGTISSGGGSVAASGFSMTVPAGAVAQPADITVLRATAGLPADPGRVSDVYAIKGLPDQTSAPITLAINCTGPPPEDGKAVIVLQQGGYDGGWVYLPATVQGNLLLATLPANAGATVGAAIKAGNERRIDLSPAEVWAFMVYVSYANTIVDSTHFRIIVTKEFDGSKGSWASDLGLAMETAVEKLAELGIYWPWTGTDKDGKPTVTKLEVTMPPLTGAEKLLCGGDVFYGKWDKQARLRLNSKLVVETADTVDISKLTAKLVHVLLHFMRHPDQPATGQPADPWLWMDEAVATWLEQKLAMATNSKYIPLQQEAFWNFAPRGLEAAAATKDREELMMHGWGASRFVTDLVTNKGTDLIKQIYTIHKASIFASLKPVEALRSDVLPASLKVDVSAAWLNFVKLTGVDTFLLSDRTNLKAALEYRSGTLQGTGTQRITFTWDAPHLSAQLFDVVMPAQWTSDVTLSASAGGDSDIVAYYYRVSSSGSVTALPEQNSFNRSSPGATFKSGDRLWIVAVNKKAVSPFTSKTAVTINVQTQAVPTYMTQIRKANYVYAGIEAMPICSYTDKKYEALGLCPRFLTSENVIISGSSSKRGTFTPTGWQQEFTVSDTGTTSSGSGSYTMSFSFNEAGDTLLKGTIERRSTYRNTSGQLLESVMKLTITGLPHVWPDTPTSTETWQTFQEARAAEAPKCVTYSYTVTVDGNPACTVTGIDWTRSLLSGKNARRESGTPGVRVYLDNFPP
jgi:uncharacterized protein (TIGR03437 family)